MGGCCPIIDGRPSGGPPGPPGPPGGCANTIRVEASDPFATLPAPVGGIITLNPETYYVFCGVVDIGPNQIECPSSSVVAGRDPLVDGITRTQLNPGPIVSFSEGGTIRDLSIVLTQVTAAIRFGGAGLNPPSAINCVVFNCAIVAVLQGEGLGGTGVLFRGRVVRSAISRLSAVGVDATVRQVASTAFNLSQIGALYCNQISSESLIPGSRQIYLEGLGSQFAASACYFQALRTDTGIEISTSPRSAAK